MPASSNGNNNYPHDVPASPSEESTVETIAEFAIVNEFASVRVRKVRTRAGERLEIASLELGHSIRLDALALEALSWQSPETISAFLETPFGPGA